MSHPTKNDVDMGGKHGRNTARLLEIALNVLGNQWAEVDVSDRKSDVLAYLRSPNITHGHAIATAVDENWGVFVEHYAPRAVDEAVFFERVHAFRRRYRPCVIARMEKEGEK